MCSITIEEVAGKQARVLSDDEIITILSREAKKRREASEAFESANRADRAALEKAEGLVIAKYLPEQLHIDDLKKMIADAIALTGAGGPADMGRVMAVVKPLVVGKADGSIVSTLVKEALNK